jgi:hypothetical protein
MLIRSPRHRPFAFSYLQAMGTGSRAGIHPDWNRRQGLIFMDVEEGASIRQRDPDCLAEVLKKRRFVRKSNRPKPKEEEEGRIVAFYSIIILKLDLSREKCYKVVI